jgi:CRISPR/Cas system-associated exonuclease Cas4 (RecB family)
MPLAILTKNYIASRIEHMSYKWIRASEISEYVYCRRAWWLKQTRGLQSGHTRQLQAGQRHHQRHGKRVRQVSWMRGLAYAMLFCVVAYIVFQLLIGG